MLAGFLFFLRLLVSYFYPAASAQGPADQSFDRTTLEKYLTVETALLGQSDNVSIYFKDEPTEQDISINAVRSWIPASSIKAFVAIEAFRQRDLGFISFDDTVTIQAQNVVPTELETDEFPRLREGTQATIRQLVEAMIIQSDNAAYNTLLDILGRRRITANLRSLGITQTVVGEKLNLDDDQFQTDLQVPGRQPNTITAKDLATLFDLLYANKIPSSDEILSIFKRQKINTMIPAFLPPGTVVAHKTGDWAPIYHDAGIVYKSNDPFVLSIMTQSNDPNVLAGLARVAFYRTAETVGENIMPPVPRTQAEETQGQRIYLAEEVQETNVLSAQAQTSDPGERMYTVTSGDTIWGIAQAQYGTGYAYTNIIGRNSLQDPGNIAVGTALILPIIAGKPFVLPERTQPAINAADIGVSDADIRAGPAQAKTIGQALVLPGSPFYLIKQWFENQALSSAPTSDAKIGKLLAISRARLSEVRRELSFGNVAAVGPLLSASEDALHKAVNLAESVSNNEVVLFRIRQHLDANFEVLREAATYVGKSQKEAYIDAVYAFYQKQKTEIQPAIASTVVTNLLEQPPTTGIVTKIHNNIASVKTDDGKVVSVALTDLTPSRAVSETTVTVAASFAVGERISVVGRITPQAVVMPQFILRNVPKELPIGRTGKVIEIDPTNHSIKIQDSTGKIDTINITGTTRVKSKDTNVDIAGIKAGSVITVVGAVVRPSISPMASPSSAVVSLGASGGSTSVLPSPTSIPKSATGGTSASGASGVQGIVPASSPVSRSIEVPIAPTVTKGGETVEARSIQVDKNASGKNEKVVGSSKSAPSGEQKSNERGRPGPQAAPPEKKKGK